MGIIQVVNNEFPTGLQFVYLPLDVDRHAGFGQGEAGDFDPELPIKQQRHNYTCLFRGALRGGRWTKGDTATLDFTGAAFSGAAFDVFGWQFIVHVCRPI